MIRVLGSIIVATRQSYWPWIICLLPPMQAIKNMPPNGEPLILSKFPRVLPCPSKPFVCTLPPACINNLREGKGQAQSSFREFSMQTQERETYLQFCQEGFPLPAPSLSFFVQFPGLLWGLYNYLSFLHREEGRRSSVREEKKGKHSYGF